MLTYLLAFTLLFPHAIQDREENRSSRSSEVGADPYNDFSGRQDIGHGQGGQRWNVFSHMFAYMPSGEFCPAVIVKCYY